MLKGGVGARRTELKDVMKRRKLKAESVSAESTSDSELQVAV